MAAPPDFVPLRWRRTRPAIDPRIYDKDASLVAQLLVPHDRESLVTSSPEPAHDELPYLAEGIDLIGQQADSGYSEAPYLIRRGDGQVVQVTELIFLVAAAIDVSGDADEVAARVSADYGRDVSADNVAYLIEKKLRPAGLLWSEGGTPAQTPRANPILALRLRLPLVPERVHRRLTTRLQPLFRLPVVVASLVTLLALDVWIATNGTGLLESAQGVIYMPQLLLPMTLLTLLMCAFHEVGHATAARYGGATPGAMGAGIYLVWPVFYTDVTDAYRLDRRGRLRVDLGGVYFNVLFTLAVGGLYLLTGHVLFLVFIFVAHIETLRQFLPFVRLDGYYIVSDLAGVPNPFAYLGAAGAWLRGHRGGRGGDRRHGAGNPLNRLTRRARVILLVWACVTVPVLLVNIVMMAAIGPRLAGAAWGSAGLQAAALRNALGDHDALAAVNGAIGLFSLVFPIGGVVYIAARLLGRAAGRAQVWWGRRPLVTGVVSTAAVLALVLQAGLTWPDRFTDAARSVQDRNSGPSDTAIRALASGAHVAMAGLEAAAAADRPANVPAAPPATAVPAGPPADEVDGSGVDAGDGDDWATGDDEPSGTEQALPVPPPAPPAPVGTPGGPAVPPPAPAGGGSSPAPTPTTVPPAGGEQPAGEQPGESTTTTTAPPSLEDLLSYVFQR